MVIAAGLHYFEMYFRNVTGLTLEEMRTEFYCKFKDRPIDINRTQGKSRAQDSKQSSTCKLTECGQHYELQADLDLQAFIQQLFKGSDDAE